MNLALMIAAAVIVIFAAAYGRGNTARAADDAKTKEADMGAVEKIPANAKAAYFAGGCFWGVEYYFDK
ncbi:hypothetical protein KDL45_13390, partial [bacterium]|nr:hypothetical protein [bacterium]